MKTKITFLLSLILFLALQISQAQQKETRSLASFEHLKVGGVAEITLQAGSQESAVVTVKNMSLADLITEVKNKTLYIRLKESNYDDIEIKIILTYRMLKSIDLSGASVVKGNATLKADKFALHSSGASKVSIKVDTKSLVLKASGASNLEIAGQADYQEIGISGATNLKAINLNSQKVRLDVSGAGNLQLNVNEELSGQISGMSKIKYRGNPSVKISKSGMGSITQVN